PPTWERSTDWIPRIHCMGRRAPSRTTLDSTSAWSIASERSSNRISKRAVTITVSGPLSCPGTALFQGVSDPCHKLETVVLESNGWIVKVVIDQIQVQ